MIGIVSILDKEEKLVDTFQLDITNIKKINNFQDYLNQLKKEDVEIRKHINTEVLKKHPENLYWICNIFTNMMNYICCIDNDN